MAHELENPGSEESAESLEAWLPGRGSMLQEISRALKAASPAWADVLLREVELLLQPAESTGLRRDTTSCAACQQALLVRRTDERLARTGGPGLLNGVRRALTAAAPGRAE